MDEIFHYQPPQVPLDILYQDKDVIVVNKPSGLLSVPGKAENRRDSMLSRLQDYAPTTLVVHRLDMDTSGLMVFALRRKAEKQLREQFRNRDVKKTYIAVVQGVLQRKSGLIDAPLAPDPLLPLRHCVSSAGKPSQTKYQVLKEGIDSTMILLQPITGRSHQLRVHLLSIGHPILGDRFYGSAVVTQRSPRLLMHATEITFRQPYSQDLLTFTCPSGFKVM
jgi:tRNA pseudouridine32 synthase / 23S rRNA pseudouridine746 synthase